MTSVREAVTASGDSDTIHVRAGWYVEGGFILDGHRRLIGESTMPDEDESEFDDDDDDEEETDEPSEAKGMGWGFERPFTFDGATRELPVTTVGRRGTLRLRGHATVSRIALQNHQFPGVSEWSPHHALRASDHRMWWSEVHGPLPAG